MSNALPIAPLAPFRASVRPPGSKSLTNRALLLAALGNRTTTLTGVLFADDTRCMLDALVALGFDLTIDEAAKTVTIAGQNGKIPASTADLFLGNAGTAYRFLTAACCLGNGEYTLDGVERMHERPIDELLKPLGKLGANITCLGEDGFPPLRVEAGELEGDELTLAPTLSSQFISALLMIGPHLPNGLTIHFAGPITSRPYVEMTIGLMRIFGIDVVIDDHFRSIHVRPGSFGIEHYEIEPDASNASYFLAVAAVIPGSTCTIEGLGKGSLQGDIGFADVLHEMGAGLAFGKDFITVNAPPTGEKLKGIDVDLNHMPDMAQTLAAVALFAGAPTTMRRIGNLRVKETDRMEAVKTELGKLGAKVTIDGDDMTIEPMEDNLLPAAIDTYDDHRMAMSFSVIGLAAANESGRPVITINDPQCVNKTFPDFFEYLDALRQSTIET